MPWPEPISLRGQHARLEPLQRSHAAALADAVRDGELWKLWYTSIPAPERMEAEIERRLSLQGAGSMVPFCSLDAAGTPVGMTTYMNIDPVHRRVEIGSTWTAARMQRSAFNTECKLLLLTHAFEALGCIAVEFRTHRFNTQSRRAIERLGAQLDGMLRSHQLASNGTLRDTAVYSIVAAEWPTVKAHLRWQLDRPRATSTE
ncbi:GNAT family N-acetyltransferase [Rivibacter subsaxonicus]|uniref:RimJ/RimL family protein N-acetyltransferase n=1 Tax=Rivibacter subsaxonicus TaxID=457575 RepID=A0A4Q7VGY2_9BURK|nr:GNAT family protein [Rivibacter subsaxonicus]RZT95309.1 RimJ/RimL family protein N-acetyltransferase [Rivibacter subsaxonicus]